MSWRDELRTASFRGATFKVRSADTRVGRRNVLHQYPGKDEPYLEDLGLDADTFVVTGYVIQSTENDFNYFAERDLLIGALKFGAGTLVHPFLGEKQVGLSGKASIRESFDRGGVAVFTMPFVLSGRPELPVSIHDVPGYTDAIATEAKADWLTSFTDKYNLDAVSDFVANSALADAVEFTNKVANEINGVIDKASDIATEVLTSISTIRNNITSIYVTAVGFASELTSMFDYYTDLLGISGSLVAESEQTDGYKQQVTDAALDTAGYGEDFDDITVNSLDTARQYSNRAATVNFIRQNMLAVAIRIAVRTEYDSYEDALAARNAVVALIDAHLLKLGDEIDDSAFVDYDEIIFDNDDDYAALQRLRSAFIGAMREVGADLAKVINYEVPSTVMSTLVLAYDKYGDLDRAGGIYERNRPAINHPGFLPEGETIEILSE